MFKIRIIEITEWEHLPQGFNLGQGEEVSAEIRTYRLRPMAAGLDELRPDLVEATGSPMQRLLAATRNITQLLPQDQVQLVRFVEEADFVIIVFDNCDLHIAITRQVAKITELLGINTLLIPVGGTHPALSEVPTSTFRTHLIPANADEERHWPEVLKALLCSCFDTGLICVDWGDFMPLFDGESVVHWKVFQAEQIQAVMTEATDWMEHYGVQNPGFNPKCISVIYRNDESFSMGGLKRELARFRRLIGEGEMVWAVPAAPIQAVTLLFPPGAHRE